MAKTIFTLLLFVVVISQTWAIQVDIPQPTYEFARGYNATIPCTFIPKNPTNPAVTIEWTAHADVPTDPAIPIISVFVGSGSPAVIDVGDGYQGRASVLYDITKGTSSLQLSSVTSKDSRVYECHVNIPGDLSGKTADSTQVVVLVAPSKPICKIQGTTQYYQNITMTCNSEEGTPTPTYKWTTFDVKNTSRPNPPKSTDVNGLLSLYNISADTSGYFICTSSNRIRSEICNLTLSVMPPSMNVASTAGIIGGCVAALLLLGIIICCCCRRNRKDKNEEYTMGNRVPEGGEYADKEPHEIEEHQGERVENKLERSENQRDQYEDHSEKNYDHRSDRYSDHQDDYDDRRARSDDRYEDRRSDRYEDRRDRYDDRRSDRNEDRRDRYDDHRSDRNDDRRSDRNDDYRNERRDRRDR